MRRLSQIAAALVLAAAGLVPLTASAVPITLPTGLNPGDQYRLAFLTSTTHDRTSSNIADYNAFVTGVANSVIELAALGTTWTAIASTSTVDARDNTSTNPNTDAGITIYLLNDTKLADNNADLWNGDLDAPLNVSESGLVVGNRMVWTGTLVDGTKSLAPLGPSSATYGGTGFTDGGWINFTSTGNTNPRSFYAVSAPLTYAPEPSTAALLALVVIGLGVARQSS